MFAINTDHQLKLELPSIIDCLDTSQGILFNYSSFQLFIIFRPMQYTSKIFW